MTFRRGARIQVAPKAQRTYGGRVYASAAESRYAAELDLKKLTGLIDSWAPQVPFAITLNGRPICKVVTDFAVTERGVTHYVEVKGHQTEIYRVKKKLLLACYPDIDYRVLNSKTFEPLVAHASPRRVELPNPVSVSVEKAFEKTLLRELEKEAR